jgi:polyhydroxyalkanoate synthesis regulator phasin
MKAWMLSLILVPFFSAGAQFGQLSPDDQKMFRNDSRDGKNHLDRIDDNVRQINKLMQEISDLRTRVQILEKKVNQLENKKDVSSAPN